MPLTKSSTSSAPTKSLAPAVPKLPSAPVTKPTVAVKKSGAPLRITHNPNFLLYTSDDKCIQDMEIRTPTPMSSRPSFGNEWRPVPGAVGITGRIVQRNWPKKSVAMYGRYGEEEIVWRIDVPIMTPAHFCSFSNTSMDGVEIVRFHVRNDYRFVYECPYTATFVSVNSPGNDNWKENMENRFPLSVGVHEFQFTLGRGTVGIGHLRSHNSPRWVCPLTANWGYNGHEFRNEELTPVPGCQLLKRERRGQPKRGDPSADSTNRDILLAKSEEDKKNMLTPPMTPPPSPSTSSELQSNDPMNAGFLEPPPSSPSLRSLLPAGYPLRDLQMALEVLLNIVQKYRQMEESEDASASRP